MKSTSAPRWRSLLACLGLACIAPSPATEGLGAGADPARVEDTHCPTAQADGRARQTLPDPFLGADGQRLGRRAQWACQRQQTLQLLQDQVYGPAAPAAERVEGRVDREQIQVSVFHQGRQEHFSARLHLPEGEGPFPAMLVMAGVAGVDPQLLARMGVARIEVPSTVFGAETGQGRRKDGAFYRLYGEQVASSGTLQAWAWGVGRIIDVIATSGGSLLRADALAVTGCSRHGKGAVAAGAFDPRIALTIPIESGAGGVPTWRHAAEGAQPAASAYGEQPWLGDGFGRFIDAPHTLAVDQHQLLGLIAPRGLLVLDNPHVAWLGASAGLTSTRAAAEIYRALGAGGNIGYYASVPDPAHCAWRPQWDGPAQAAIQRHLLRQPAPDLAVPAVHAEAPPAWRWSTPVLE
jgi:hypothetical protein